MTLKSHPRSTATSAAIGNYGMAVVLLLLCVFFAAATIRERQPSGAEGGEALIAALAPRAGTAGTAAGRVVVVGRDIEEDRAFVSAFTNKLDSSKWEVASIVQGQPRDVRLALEKLASQGQKIDAIATTPECASWTVLHTSLERLPALGSPTIQFPTATRWPVFLTRQNLLNVANQIVVVAILAAGMTFVILTGGIDLSVGSIIALAAVVAARLVRDRFGGVDASAGGLVAAAMAGIALSAAIGLISGASIVQFRLPPFIATLAVMQVASGLAFILAKGQSIYEIPDSAVWLGRGAGLFGLPHAVALMLAVFAGAHVLLTRTVLGRQIYAVGGNETAARLSGVPTDRVKLFAYAACAGLAGLGGIVMASQLKSGSPTYGASYELYAIAAVVVGGASLTGGQGDVIGTLIGALIIAVINNGMNLMGVESYTQKIVLGLVILGAVLLDRFKRRLAS